MINNICVLLEWLRQLLNMQKKNQKYHAKQSWTDLFVFCSHACNFKNSQLILRNANIVGTVNVKEMRQGGRRRVEINLEFMMFGKCVEIMKRHLKRGWRDKHKIKSQNSRGLDRLDLLQDTLWGGSSGGISWPCLMAFLGLRLQPFPLFFLLLLGDCSGTGG